MDKITMNSATFNIKKTSKGYLVHSDNMDIFPCIAEVESKEKIPYIVKEMIECLLETDEEVNYGSVTVDGVKFIKNKNSVYNEDLGVLVEVEHQCDLQEYMNGIVEMVKCSK